eukprot:4408381-Pleurochrysis_carterae.AAC.2
MGAARQRLPCNTGVEGARSGGEQGQKVDNDVDERALHHMHHRGDVMAPSMPFPPQFRWNAGMRRK